ncbi:MAG TPA: NAD(P)/FAD-dependent oxidoreductase [Pyrinomonadaceae bacterium]|nr:NAD(P)/FAD-dependent oxidoreductase [Pyrinomonadaceae bacterium]
MNNPRAAARGILQETLKFVLPTQHYDVIIIGGGAAGLFCAVEAGKRGRKVLVLEHNDKVGKKISISGGGRCNFTNIGTSPENFVSANPHFCKSALARFSPEDFIALVEKHHIEYYEKKLGQLFCKDSSQRIIDLLLSECLDAGVEIRCQCEVRTIAKDDEFVLETNQGAVVASSVVIATGGLSIAPLGASDFGYRIARQFGLSIEDARPALVPFTLSADLQNQLAPLSGISADVTASTARNSFRENLLVTHRGLSGPAILQISLYWEKGKSISIDLMPDHNAYELLKDAGDRDIELATLLSEYLPRRFAQAWSKLYLPGKRTRQLTDSDRSSLARMIHEWQIKPSGTEGFKKAEVTAGGVSTSELSSQTMEAKRVPGLYFIGEVVDVTGQLGGFNFQWAWASAYAAGQNV